MIVHIAYATASHFQMLDKVTTSHQFYMAFDGFQFRWCQRISFKIARCFLLMHYQQKQSPTLLYRGKCPWSFSNLSAFNQSINQSRFLNSGQAVVQKLPLGSLFILHKTVRK